MVSMKDARIRALYRYPVKGLSPEPLKRVAVATGETLPGDRAWAIENGAAGFDPSAPQHLPKTSFIMLMKQGRLAAFNTYVDLEEEVLTIQQDGVVLLEASLETSDGRRAIEAFYSQTFGSELRGEPKIRHVPGFSFSDVPDKCVSIVNLESLRDLERRTGFPIDPLRFRSNIYIDGIAAWEEFGWIDRMLNTGTVRLEVFSRTVRCAATEVNPSNGERDFNTTRALMEHFGHMDCGIYARVVEGGTLAEGALLTLEAPPVARDLPFAGR